MFDQFDVHVRTYLQTNSEQYFQSRLCLSLVCARFIRLDQMVTLTCKISRKINQVLFHEKIISPHDLSGIKRSIYFLFGYKIKLNRGFVYSFYNVLLFYMLLNMITQLFCWQIITVYVHTQYNPQIFIFLKNAVSATPTWKSSETLQCHRSPTSLQCW